MDSSNHIAVIGMAGRFPQAPNLRIFWENICSGLSSVQQFSSQEMLADGVPPEAVAAKNYRSARAILEDAEGFDASFFGISPSEAELLDPQHRNFLELCWLALEDGNIRHDRFDGRIGVFASTGVNAYALFHLTQNATLSGGHSPLQALMSSDKDYLATRVSYKLNLHGPSISVQTACSSSLVAVHVACQSLLSGECDLALAGGVTIRFPQKGGYFYSEGGIYSPDGNCRPFDATANGTVDGSGAGVVLLKRLEDAYADNDAISAIILATAVNNDGSRKVGFTAPSIPGQAQVIAEAQELAQVPADSIGYIEAHGTGTQLGDPIEVRALTQVFREHTPAKNFCALSSVKANIGHLDTAAGIAGFIKACLVVKNGVLPPAPYFEKPNPELQLENSPFFISPSKSPWPESPHPRRAGISSFGVGGTNAHVIIQQARQRKPSQPDTEPQLFFCSAKTGPARSKLCESWNETLLNLDSGSFADAAHTSREGRIPLQHRAFWVGSPDELPATRWQLGTLTKITSPIVFVFPGQGLAIDGILGPLVEWHPALKAKLETLSARAQPLLHLNLFPLLTQSSEEASAQLRKTEIAQPALFICELALAEFLMEADLKPWALIGHSLGEYVAATLSGVFSVDDALKLVVQRGQLMAQQPAGAMTAVGLSAAELEQYLETFQLELAVVNGPQRCVVSGPTSAIAALEHQLATESVVTSRLPTTHAFHSRLMDGCLPPFRHAVASISTNTPAIPFVSNLTGTWIETNGCSSAGYWSNHLRRTVQFEKGLRTLCENESPIFLTVGPDMGLGALLKNLPNEQTPKSISLLPKKSHPSKSLHHFLTGLGRLWLSGKDLRAGFLERGRARNLISVPLYPFQHQTFTLKKMGRQANQPAEKELPTWFYTPNLKRLPPVAPPEETTPKPTVLLFCNPGEVAIALEAFLEQQAVPFYRIQTMPHQSQDRSILFHVDLGQSNWAETLRQQLPSPPTHILYAWSVSTNPSPSDPDAEPYQPLLLRPLQVLKTFASTQELRAFTAITAGGLSLFPQKVEAPLAMSLLGFLNSAALEFPKVAFKALDFDPASLAAFKQKEAQWTWWECLEQPCQRAVVYRSQQRFGMVLEPLDLPLKTSAQGFSKADTILITGGFGDLGMALAESLARAGAGTLVLATRRHLKDRDSHPGRLKTKGERNLTARLLNRVAYLESFGTKVHAVTCDVTRVSDLVALKSEIERLFGKLTGIIHGAGTAKGASIPVLTDETFIEALAVKHGAAKTMVRIFKSHPIQWFVTFSSLSSVTGAKNLAAYTAANAALDGFAHARLSHQGAHTVSINWGPWSEAGMAVQNDPCTWLLSMECPSPSEHTDPLIDRILYEHPRYSIYETTFSPDHHWFLNEHRYEAHAVMPGAFYLEWCRRIYGSLPEGAKFHLEHLYFLSPLMMDPEPVWTLRTITFWVSKDQWEVHIFGKPVTEEGVFEWRKFVMASVSCSHEMPQQKASVPDVRTWAALTGEGSARLVGAGLQLGPHWDVIESVFKRDHQILAHLSLPEDYSHEIGSMPLHTSLLDMATGLASRFSDKPQSLLPFSYRDLVVYQPVPAQCICLLECLDKDENSQQTVKARLTLFDQNHVAVITIGEFTMRAIQLQSSANLAPPKAIPKRPVGIPTQMGVQAFHTILANRLGPQIIVSPQDPRAVSQPPIEIQGEGITSQQHPRPALDVPFLAPSSKHEHILTEIWSRLLGIEQLGVLDNFFELGGDSVMGLQIVSRLKEAGYQISPQAIFDHPTVQSLAEVLDPRGGLPFRPFPIWQASILENTGCWDDYHVLRCQLPTPASIQQVEAWVQGLVTHLPYLRSSIHHENVPGLAMANDTLGPAQSHLGSHHLITQPNATPSATREGAFPLFQWQAMPEDRDIETLDFRIHPLLTDGQGLKVFMGTFETIWRGKTPTIASSSQVPSTHSSTVDPADHQPAQDAFEQEAASTPKSTGPLPDLIIQQETLVTAETEVLKKAHQPFRTRTGELVLSVLKTLSHEDSLPFAATIHVEARPHGENADAAGAFGWESGLVALSLEEGSADIIDTLLATKEQLRSLQRHPTDPNLLPDSPFLIADWGDLTPKALEPSSPALQWEPIVLAARLGPSARTYPIQLQIWQWFGTLRFTWFYNQERFTDAQISQLSKRIQTGLQTLLNRLCQTEEGSFTPSDFPNADLDDRELASLLEEFGDVGGVS